MKRIPAANKGSSIPNDGDRYRYGRKISTSFAESTVNQVISKRMVTLASRSMYTNHCNSTLDKQERELYVRPSVRSECVGAPSTNRRQKCLYPGSLQKKFSAHSEQRKRRAIFAVFEVKKEIPD